MTKTHRQEFLELARANGFMVEEKGLLLTKKLAEGRFLLLVQIDDEKEYVLSVWNQTDYDGMPVWEGNDIWSGIFKFEHFNQD